MGANLGNPIDQCKQALCNIRLLPKTEVVRSSSFYLSEPLKSPQMHNQPVPSYINTVCQLKTELSAEDLLEGLLTIEKKMGRVRREKWASRVIDLDLLFYGNQVMTSDSLTLPHPQMQNRNFVLEPLCEIAHDWYHPVYNKTIRELAAIAPAQLRLHKLATSS